MADSLNDAKNTIRKYFADKGDNGDQRNWRELKEEAGDDSLTGFLNRKAFNERARSTIGRDRAYTLIMIDLDKFKSINDSYGHSGGDFVLTQTADLVRELIREGDLVCRWGGEEFVILLPDVVDDAESVAERFRAAFEKRDIIFEGKKINRTGSFGVVKGSGKDSLDETIRLADDLMYKAKQAGRNQVMVA